MPIPNAKPGQALLAIIIAVARHLEKPRMNHPGAQEFQSSPSLCKHGKIGVDLCRGT